MLVPQLNVCLVFCLLCPANIFGLWWVAANPLLVEPNSICRKIRRLGGKQRELCRKEPEIVAEVAKGTHLAISECQVEFRDRRWNCSTAHRAIRKVIKLDTRETGFVNAIMAAGVVHAVTEACTQGSLLQCTCDDSVRDVATDGEWEWGGCGDDVSFGYRKSREFMDVVKRRRRSDIRSKLLLHNNEAGRLAIVKHMRMVCKCHGLSGSCALKTCWKKMPHFHDVGARLKSRFDGASQVTISNDGVSLVPVGGRTIKPIGLTDIVYSGVSPDYCVPNRQKGSLGTRGRECDPKSFGISGCELLCCQRGYATRRVKRYENCRCKFHWCCEVVCDTCITVHTVHTCL